jgi:hypothetical protein
MSQATTYRRPLEEFAIKKETSVQTISNSQSRRPPMVSAHNASSLDAGGRPPMQREFANEAAANRGCEGARDPGRVADILLLCRTAVSFASHKNFSKINRHRLTKGTDV